MKIVCVRALARTGVAVSAIIKKLIAEIALHSAAPHTVTR